MRIAPERELIFFLQNWPLHDVHWIPAQRCGDQHRDQPWVRVHGPAGPHTVTNMSNISGYVKMCSAHILLRRLTSRSSWLSSKLRAFRVHFQLLTCCWQRSIPDDSCKKTGVQKWAHIEDLEWYILPWNPDILPGSFPRQSSRRSQIRCRWGPGFEAKRRQAGRLQWLGLLRTLNKQFWER